MAPFTQTETHRRNDAVHLDAVFRGFYATDESGMPLLVKNPDAPGVIAEAREADAPVPDAIHVGIQINGQQFHHAHGSKGLSAAHVIPIKTEIEDAFVRAGAVPQSPPETIELAKHRRRREDAIAAYGKDLEVKLVFPFSQLDAVRNGLSEIIGQAAVRQGAQTGPQPA